MPSTSFTARADRLNKYYPKRLIVLACHWQETAHHEHPAVWLPSLRRQNQIDVFKNAHRLKCSGASA
eukprot:1721038-Pleurochrysis_carterae.AAC.2